MNHFIVFTISTGKKKIEIVKITFIYIYNKKKKI